MNQVILSPEEQGGTYKRLSAPAGVTVAAILVDAVKDGHLRLEDVPLVRVRVNGKPVAREDALDVVVKNRDHVNISVEPQGGDTGRTLFQLFYTIGAIVVGSMFGPWASAAVLAAGTALSMIIWKPSNDQLSANAPAALEDQSNEYRRRMPFPLVLGRQRVAFDVAAQPYTQLIGNDVWLHVVFGIHYGPCVLEDIKIGETLLADYPAADVIVEQFLDPGPRNITTYPGQVTQLDLQDKLDMAGGGTWEVQTAALITDRIEVDITLPQGLKFVKDGKIGNEEVSGRIEYAEVGTEGWAGAPIGQFRNKNNQVLPAGTFYINAKSADPVRRTYSFAVPDRTKQYKVRVKAYDDEGRFPDDRSTWDTYWTALRSIQNDPPILDETLSLIALKVKSTNDLNGSLPVVSAIVTPVVPLWNGADWTTEGPSSNPAELARWLATGPAPAFPLREDQIDPSVEDAAELITERDWDAALLLKGEVTIEDAIIALGRAGRFGTYWNGQALVFVPDWEKPAPRQMFTGRNAENYRYGRTFPDTLHAVFVEFRNLDKDSQGDELWVYADGYNAGNAEVFETLRLDMVCTGNRAYREGRVYLAKREHQSESHEWDAGVDAVGSTFGDRVLLRHYSAVYGQAEGRVQFRRLAGGMVSGVRLDEAVRMQDGLTYALDVRSPDKVIRGLDVITTPGWTRDLTFPVPLAPEDAPVKDDLVVFGETQLLTEDLELIDVEPGQGFTATLRAHRYAAAEIEAAETGPVPPIVTPVKTRAAAPIPRIIGVTPDPSGVIVSFDVDPQRLNLIEGFTFRWRPRPTDELNADAANDWVPTPSLPANARVARTPALEGAAVQDGDVAAEVRIDVELRVILKSGGVGKPAVQEDILVQRVILPPEGLQVVPVTRTGPDGSSYGALYVTVIPLEGGAVQDLQVEVKPTADPDVPANWRPAGQPLPALNPQGDLLDLDAGRAYDTRVRWRTDDNWTSSWVRVNNKTVPAGSNVSNDTVNVGGMPATAVLQDLSDLLVDVNNLYEVYGDTASAAASAAAAAASEDAAEAARNAALLYRDDAEDQAGYAAGYAANSQSYRNQAEGFATASQGSAVAASVSASGALLTAASTLPSDFSQGTKFWREYWYGTPPARESYPLMEPPRASFYDVPGIGKVLRARQDGVGYTECAPIGWVKIEPGRRGRVIARVRALTNAAAQNIWVRIVAFGADGSADGLGTADAFRNLTVAEGWTDVATEFNHSDLGGRAYLRHEVLLNYPSGTQDLELASLRYQDITESYSATNSASAAQSSAATATAQAAAAQTSASLAATVNSSSLGQNSYFDAYPSGAVGTLPTGWSHWTGGVNYQRVPDGQGGYAIRIPGDAGGNNGIDQFTAVGTLAPLGWYVAEAEAELTLGSYNASGIYVVQADAAGAGAVAFNVPFAGQADDSGALSNSKLGRRTWSSLFQANSSGTLTRFHIYAMSHWSGHGDGNISVANELIWYRLLVRPAQAAEIEQRQARGGFSSLSAKITDVANVAASATSAVALRTTTLEARSGGSNLLPYASFRKGLGYAEVGTWTHGATSAVVAAGIWPHDDNWGPPGERPLYTQINSATPAGNYAEWISAPIPVEITKRYVASVYSGTLYTNQTHGQLFMYVCDAAGVPLANTGGQTGDNLNNSGNTTGGPRLDNSKRLYNFSSGIGSTLEFFGIPGIQTIRVVLRGYVNANGGDEHYLFWNRIMLSEATPTQTQPPPWAPASMESRVSTSEGAIATLNGRNAAWLQQEVNAGSGAVAFSRLYAETSPGVITSSVSFGAQEFHVYNQVGNGFLKALSVIGGNAVLTGSLRVGANILMGSGEGWPVAYGQKDLLFTDGQTRTFGVTFDNPPGYTFTASNLAPLNAGESYAISLDVTRTQATASIKILTPASPTNYTNIAPTFTGGTSAPDYQVGVTSASRVEAIGGNYDLEISTSWNTSYYSATSGEMMEYQEPLYGNVYVNVYALKSSVWTLISTEIFGHYVQPSGYMFSGWNPLGDTYSEVRTIALGTGVQAIGLQYDSSDGNYGPYAGGQASLTDASWQAPGADSGVRSATPTGQQVKFTMSPK